MDRGVLFVTPFPQDGKDLAGMLNDISIRVVHAASLAEAEAQLKAKRFGVVLCEANLVDGSWLDLLELTRIKRIELVVTDAFADARFWATAINLGAYDMLAQPFHLTEVRRVLAAAARQLPTMEVRAAGS